MIYLVRPWATSRYILDLSGRSLQFSICFSLIIFQSLFGSVRQKDCGVNAVSIKSNLENELTKIGVCSHILYDSYHQFGSEKVENT